MNLSEDKPNNNERYIAMTIGPIIKTLLTARKTREIWGASYLFSYIMRTVLEKLVERGIPADDILIPYAGEINPGNGYKYAYGAGLYPDRLFIRASNCDIDILTDVIITVSEEIAGNIADHLKIKDNEKKKSLQRYIDDYFLFHALETGVPENESPILTLSPYLDTGEMEDQYIHCDDCRYIAAFLDNINDSFLFEDAFSNPPPGVDKKEKFESLIQIAAGDLAGVIGQKTFDTFICQSFKESNEDEYIIQKIKRVLREKELSDRFKTYHKYIAIVHADGDNFGQTIEEKKGNPDGLAQFSRTLQTYARDAAKIIYDYGGSPIYIGGDDLFFFAPVCSFRGTNAQASSPPETSTVFDLIDSLDLRFNKDFPNASLSFGVSITYYKFPLAEARNNSYDLLIRQAKKIEKKNALAFQVLKHSGRSFGTVLLKDSGIYREFKELLNQYGGDTKHLNSVVNTTELHKGILNRIGDNLDQVLNFFENTFNEEIHIENTAFIETAGRLFFKVFNESPAEWDNSEKYDSFYALLRTLHFLKRNDTDNE